MPLHFGWWDFYDPVKYFYISGFWKGWVIIDLKTSNLFINDMPVIVIPKLSKYNYDWAVNQPNA